MLSLFQELKKRGETISTLTKSRSDASKENERALEQIFAKENTIVELNEKLTSQLKGLETVETEFGLVKAQLTDEVKERTEQIARLTAELDSLREQIRSKDDLITTLRNDVQKQKEMQGSPLVRSIFSEVLSSLCM